MRPVKRKNHIENVGVSLNTVKEWVKQGRISGKQSTENPERVLIFPLKYT